MQVQPYLFLNGRAEEAIEFYKKALGAEVVMMMRFKEQPPEPAGDAGDGCAGQLPPNWGEKIMHATIQVGDAQILLSDGMGEDTGFKGFSLALSAKELNQVQRWFDGLADGGQVFQPVQKTFFSEGFGMLSDRFGVSWMCLVA